MEFEWQPLKLEGQPAKFKGRPLEFEVWLLKFEGRCSKCERRPLKFEGRPLKCAGRPWEFEGRPLQCEGRSLEFEAWSLEFGVEGPVPAFPRKHSVDNTPKCLSLVRVGGAGGGTTCTKTCTDVRSFQCSNFWLYFVSSYFLSHSPIPLLFPFVF